MNTLNTDIKLKASPAFISILVVVWLVANIMVFTLSIPFLLKVVLWAAMLMYMRHTLNLHIFFHHPNAVSSLQLQDSQWYVNQTPVILLGDSTVTSLVSILRFKSQTSRKIYTSIVLPDSLREIPYSQLVMMLRTVDILAHEK